MEELLVRTKREKPTFIPYFISACKDLPGKFILGYQPRGKPRVEFVTITPDGFRYRSQIFPTVNGLFRWFKDHYQEPVPGITPSNSSRTRTPASLNATPANINIAGESHSLPHTHTNLHFQHEWSCSTCYDSLLYAFLPRLDARCQRPPTQHDLSDVQCHRCSHRPGPEPKHHPCTVELQPVRLRWQLRRRRREFLCLSCICHTSAAHCDAPDDAQLLLHHTEPAGPGHTAVPRLNPAVLTLSRTRPHTRRPPVAPRTSRPSQQPPRPLVRHAVILHIIQRTDSAAAAAAAKGQWQQRLRSGLGQDGGAMAEGERSGGSEENTEDDATTVTQPHDREHAHVDRRRRHTPAGRNGPIGHVGGVATPPPPFPSRLHPLYCLFIWKTLNSLPQPISPFIQFTNS